MLLNDDRLRGLRSRYVEAVLAHNAEACAERERHERETYDADDNGPEHSHYSFHRCSISAIGTIRAGALRGYQSVYQFEHKSA